MVPRSYPGSTLGIDPRSQGMVPRRFKQKNNFVTDARTHARTNTWTDRRDGRNSYLDNALIYDSCISLDFLSIKDLRKIAKGQ